MDKETYADLNREYAEQVAFAGDPVARREIEGRWLALNTGLARVAARRFSLMYDLSFQDCFAEALLGLWDAIQCHEFRPERGDFRAYATYAIRDRLNAYRRFLNRRRPVQPEEFELDSILSRPDRLSADDLEVIERITRTLAGSSPAACLFRMLFTDGLNYRQAALSTGVSRQAVGRSVRRRLDSFRRQFANV